MTKREREYKNAMRQHMREHRKIMKCRCPQTSKNGWVRNSEWDLIIPAKQFQAKCANDHAKALLKDHPELNTPGIEGEMTARFGNYKRELDREFVMTLTRTMEIMFSLVKIKVEGV